MPNKVTEVNLVLYEHGKSCEKYDETLSKPLYDFFVNDAWHDRVYPHLCDHCMILWKPLAWNRQPRYPYRVRIGSGLQGFCLGVAEVHLLSYVWSVYASRPPNRLQGSMGITYNSGTSS